MPDRAVGRFSSLYVLASGKRWRKPLSVTVLSLAENIGRRGPDGKTNRFVQSTHGTLEVASRRHAASQGIERQHVAAPGEDDRPLS